MRSTIIIFIILTLCSCKEKQEQNTVRINSYKHDTLTKSYTVQLDNEYTIIGKSDSINEIIKSHNTFQNVTGEFGIGLKEKGMPQNKAFIFSTDHRINFDSLPKIEDPYGYSLVEEFEISTNEDELKTILIDLDTNALTNTKAYKITFTFLNIQNDTIGFQNTYQLIHQNQLCTINYLSESIEKYLELENVFEGIALKAN